MNNEILLILNLIVIYGGMFLFYRLFGKSGLYTWTAVATIAANIEVLLVIEAFGMEQTLGNILFASTFLTTDILSENHGKKAANKAVKIGIAVSVMFIIISGSWLLFTPSENDFAHGAFEIIFSNTPRIMFAGFAVYAVVQVFDVWAYHKWWSLTEKKTGDAKKFLWLRNNGSTLLSQALNALLFNVIAFYGVYDLKTLISIVISTYVIYIFTSLLDTPVVYAARKLYEKGKIK